MWSLNRRGGLHSVSKMRGPEYPWGPAASLSPHGEARGQALLLGKTGALDWVAGWRTMGRQPGHNEEGGIGTRAGNALLWPASTLPGGWKGVLSSGPTNTVKRAAALFTLSATLS